MLVVYIMQNDKIVIYGAGISGLVAAVNLKQKGFDVCVCDIRKSIGGVSSWHPSVHHQTFDVISTSRYIGIDVSSCFKPVECHMFSFYGKKSMMRNPENSFVCEKGPQSTSIESYLYQCAISSGVEFKFNESFGVDIIRENSSRECRVIVATGLEEKPYKNLGIHSIPIQGYRAMKEHKNPVMVKSLFGNYTNHDFAYCASSGSMTFSLLFSRLGINEENLDEYKRYLEDNYGESFDGWGFSTGCVPVEKNLVKNNVVLAGTISGMIDPFYLNGISGALVSGKIASLYFTDREEAFRDFSAMTKNYNLKRRLKWIADKMPVKRITFPILAYANNHFKWVGVV